MSKGHEKQTNHFLSSVQKVGAFTRLQKISYKGQKMLSQSQNVHCLGNMM